MVSYSTCPEVASPSEERADRESLEKPAEVDVEVDKWLQDVEGDGALLPPKKKKRRRRGKPSRM